MASTVEPDTAPPADTYFPLVLGPTILEPGSTRYYSLRYEFKPASIDTGSPGTLHKGAENKVTVEWSNNQAGKPKVAFQGNSEDAKDFDAVIFFDGTSFRLERLHRAVKSLRHLRQGETAAALAGSGGGGSGAVSPIHSNGGHAMAEKNQFKAHHITETITDEAPVAPKPEAAPAPAPAKKPTKRKGTSSKAAANKKQSPVGVVKEASPELEIDEFEMMPEPEPDIEPEPEPKRAKPSTPVTAPAAAAAAAAAAPVEEVDILGEDDVEVEEIVEEHSDYEIEDVDVSEDEEAEKAGGANDPAATLRAQAAAEAAGNKSSTESGSSSSDSGSGSSSSESGSDDEDSASSGDDI